VTLFRPIILLLLVLVLMVSWWRWQPEPGELRRVRMMMGTTVEILARHPDPDRLEPAVTAAFAELDRIEQLLSSYLPDSELSRLAQSRQPMTVSAETAEVLALGLEISAASSGAFDIGLGRLKQLWGLDGDNPRVPSPEEIAAARHGLGPDALRLQGRQAIRQSADALFDLGGIAKGYAVDRAVAVLKEQGITSAAVNAGGDMYLLGQRQARPWRIGLQHPRQTDATIATVNVTDRAVVTSGDYERFFEQDSRRYHHLLDPHTGYPAERCQSVTVIAESVALADALATAVFVLGPTAGLALLEHYPDSEGLIIDPHGQPHTTANWSGDAP
jgi:thiamine biosynthesis lipoprotein